MITPSTPELGFDDVLNSMKNGFADVVKLFDGGLALYGAIPSRVEALKQINSEISKSITNPAPAPIVDTVGNFFKANSGFVTIAAIAVLVVLAVKD